MIRRRSRRGAADSDETQTPAQDPSSAPVSGDDTATSASGLQPPSIWVGSFESAADWHRGKAAAEAVWGVFDDIDDLMLRSRHAFSIRGHCVVCDRVTEMAMAWHLGGINPAGSVNPAWTLNARCGGCGLVSRMRALVDHLITHGLLERTTLVAERVTESYLVLERLIDDLTGFEYLGSGHEPGSSVDIEGVSVRHDDIEQLSAPDESFGLVITQDVFEHVADLPRSFEEAHRVLSPGGRLVFTVPCFAHLDETEVLAHRLPDGTIEQLVEPPEIHGNPVGDGSLCLRHIGWDVLDQLREAGFRSATAHCYWGPWAGHLGGPSFVYEAER